MATPDPVQSEKILKGMLAAVGLLLILSNLMWYIAYTTATSPLANPTRTPTPTLSATPTPSTDLGRSANTVSPSPLGGSSSPTVTP